LQEGCAQLQNDLLASLSAELAPQRGKIEHHFVFKDGGRLEELELIERSLQTLLESFNTGSPSLLSLRECDKLVISSSEQFII
jgi:hypothetical protein